MNMMEFLRDLRPVRTGAPVFSLEGGVGGEVARQYYCVAELPLGIVLDHHRSAEFEGPFFVLKGTLNADGETRRLESVANVSWRPAAEEIYDKVVSEPELTASRRFEALRDCLDMEGKGFFESMILDDLLKYPNGLLAEIADQVRSGRRLGPDVVERIQLYAGFADVHSLEKSVYESESAGCV
jgi:hypothetical protein